MKNPITAKRLSLALSNLNMKPQELANRSGVSKASISQYLSGSHAPSNISSGKMAKILDVDPVWLMGFDVPMKKPIIAGKFQATLKSLRTSHGLTQDELSDSLKLSRSTIGMYESGAREPDFKTLGLIADYFNVDTDFLLGRTDKVASFSAKQENDLILSFRKLNTENKKRCSAYATSLLATQEMEDAVALNAAHDSGATSEQKQHADNIMEDPDEWT